MARNCPGCGQEIHVDPRGKTECGGLDEGICAATQYAFDVTTNPEDAVKEWHHLEGMQNPPTPEVCRQICEAHGAASRRLADPKPTVEDPTFQVIVKTTTSDGEELSSRLCDQEFLFYMCRSDFAMCRFLFTAVIGQRQSFGDGTNLVTILERES